ncbi:hypothetical protein ABK040_008332 [Willaertia magna]
MNRSFRHRHDECCSENECIACCGCNGESTTTRDNNGKSSLIWTFLTILIVAVVAMNSIAFLFLYKEYKKENKNYLQEKSRAISMEQELIKLKEEYKSLSLTKVSTTTTNEQSSVTTSGTVTTTEQQPIVEVKKKNRIAIVISGAIRSFPDNFYFLYRNFLEINGFPDLFFSLVYTTDQEKKDFEKVLPHVPNVKKVQYERFDMDKFTQQARSDGYNHFPFPPHMCQDLLGAEKGCINWMSSLYLLYKANELRKEYEKEMKIKTNLKENEQIYDLVMRMRSDILFEHIYDLTDIPIEPDTFYKPKLYNWLGGYNDQLGFGPPNVIDAYAQSYFYVERIRKEHHISYHPENYLRITLAGYFKITKFKDLDITYRIVRSIEFAPHTLEFRLSAPHKFPQLPCTK